MPAGARDTIIGGGLQPVAPSSAGVVPYIATTIPPTSRDSVLRRAVSTGAGTPEVVVVGAADPVPAAVELLRTSAGVLSVAAGNVGVLAYGRNIVVGAGVPADSVVVGQDVDASLAVGGGATAANVVVGSNITAPNANFSSCVVIGDGCVLGSGVSSITQSVVIGALARVGNPGSVVIGYAATITGVNTGVCIGAAASMGSSGGVAVGGGATTAGNQTVAVGQGAQATATQTTAVGDDARATALSAVAVGAVSRASVADAIALGVSASASHAGSIVVGRSAVSVVARGAVIGHGLAGSTLTSLLVGGRDTEALYPGLMLRCVNGVGADNAVGALTIVAPLSTGNVASAAPSGGIILQTGELGASGAAVQAATARLSIAGGTGNIALHGMADFGSGRRVLAVGNALTVPTTNPVGGGVLYADAGALKWRGSAGTVTTLAAA